MGEHTSFIIEFTKSFIDGEIDRFFFDLDYNAYVIEHFPYMEEENPRLAERFADIVDQAYEWGTNNDLSDEEFRELMRKAVKKWLD